MATETTARTRELDVRSVDGEPFGDIMSALESLEPDEELLLINSFEPVPLYDVLESRGFEHETTERDGTFHVRIEQA